MHQRYKLFVALLSLVLFIILDEGRRLGEVFSPGAEVRNSPDATIVHLQPLHVISATAVDRSTPSDQHFNAMSISAMSRTQTKRSSNSPCGQACCAHQEFILKTSMKGHEGFSHQSSFFPLHLLLPLSLLVLSGLHEPMPIILLFTTISPLTSALVVVAPNGSNESSCGLITNPCTLRYALNNQVAPNDTILLLPGLYADPNVTTTLSNGSITIESSASESVTLDCGSQPGPYLFMTGQGVFSLIGVRVQNCHYGPTPIPFPSWGSALVTDQNVSLHVENVTFWNNSAASPSSVKRHCGGAVVSQGYGEFLDCTFEENHFVADSSANGGAVCVYGNTLFRDCTFRSNGAINLPNPRSTTPGALGGAVFANGDADFTFLNCVFLNNSATGGSLTLHDSLGFVGEADAGAVSVTFMIGGTCTFENCTFMGNLAQGGSSPSNYTTLTSGMTRGGAVSIIRPNAPHTNEKRPVSAKFTACNFTHNTACGGNGFAAGDSYGGAIHIELYPNTTGHLHVIGCRFEGNAALSTSLSDANIGGTTEGGAIVANFVSLEVTNSEFAHNVALTGPATHPASSFGGAVSCMTESFITICNCSFRENAALGGAGGPASVDGSIAFGGAAFLLGLESVSLIDSRFFSNRAIGGNSSAAQGGMAFGGALYSGINEMAEVTVTRCHFAENVAHGGFGKVLGGSVQAGALFIALADFIVLRDNTFSENRAIGGFASLLENQGDACGGAVLVGSLVRTELFRNYFESNQVHAGATNVLLTGWSATGGALMIKANASRTRVEECTFSRNLAAAVGRKDTAVAIGGALMSLALNNAEVTVLRCNFTGNGVRSEQQASGGALASVAAQSFALNDSHFIGNYAYNGFGGALFFFLEISVTIVNGSFLSNNATVGGAITAIDSSVALLNSNFTAQSAICCQTLSSLQRKDAFVFTYLPSRAAAIPQTCLIGPSLSLILESQEADD